MKIPVRRPQVTPGALYANNGRRIMMEEAEDTWSLYFAVGGTGLRALQASVEWREIDRNGRRDKTSLATVNSLISSSS
jgi:hypothetical protein